MANTHCKCKEEECEECPEWIFTLADLIMCMMGLFVILWVLKPGAADPVDLADNSPQAERWYETLGEIKSGFGWEPDPASSAPLDQIMMQKRLRNAGEGQGGKTLDRPRGAVGEHPEVTTIRPGRLSTVGGKLVFEAGDATLSPSAKTALDEIAEMIRGHRNIVIVKGHTSRDDFPDGTDEAAKMALSLQRAQAAADYLISQGVSADTLRVQGCSTFEPVEQRAYTLDRQMLNRRVEVDATATLVPELQENPASPSLP